MTRGVSVDALALAARGPFVLVSPRPETLWFSRRRPRGADGFDHMVRRSLLIAALLFPWVPPVASGQAGPPVLELRDLVAEAIERNPELAALRAGHVAAGVKPDTERFLMPPMVEGQAVEWPINSWNPRNAQWMVMLQQEFPGRGKRALRADVMAREAAVAGNDVAVRTREVIAEVKRSWTDYVLAASSLAIYEESLALLRQVADLAEVKYGTGRGTQQDLHKALLDMARLYDRRVMANEQAGMAAARLNALVGRPPDAPLGRPGSDALPGALPDSSSLQRAALDQHPELQGMVLETKVAEASVALARAERRPDFFVQGGYMVTPYMPDALTARIGISWPGAPWARKRLGAVERAAQADVDTTRARQQAAANRVRLMVHEAFLKVTSAEERAALLALSVLPQTEHTLEMTRVAYQSDRGDFMSFLDTQRMLLDMRLEHRRAIAERDRALAELELAVGTDLATVASSIGPAPVLEREP
jgi:outer membrane protein TolC